MKTPNPLDPKILLERLQALEAENAKLKQGKFNDPNQLVVTESEYMGHPVLEFRKGNSKGFNMGLRKLEIIQEAWPEVEKFIRKHSQESNESQILI